MTKFADISNASVIDAAGASVASKWVEQKYGFFAARVFSKEAGLPLVFSCTAEVVQSAVAERNELAREAAETVCTGLSQFIDAGWNSYEGRDSEYFVAGTEDGKDVLLVNIDASQVLSYHDFTITAFATNSYKDLACALVGLAMIYLDPYVTRYRGAR